MMIDDKDDNIDSDTFCDDSDLTTKVVPRAAADYVRQLKIEVAEMSCKTTQQANNMSFYKVFYLLATTE